MRYTALILILLAGAANAETFKCQAGPVWFDDEAILVVLTVDDESKSWTIKVAGGTYTAVYRVEGIDRRWDFSPQDDDAFDYAFVMQPSGNASYYDLSDIELGESAPPRQQFICK